MKIELNEFKNAQKRIEKIAHRTQLLYVNTFSKMSGADIYLKLENEQKTGSFKIRGATNKIAKMVEFGDKSPVIASSAGNHAQGVAYAASMFGIKSTIVMPAKAPIAKVVATKNYGAEVVLHGDCYDDAYNKAIEICKSTGAKFLHPFDDLDVIAGQGTIGLEIMEQLPDADIVLVPAGGGGLLSGVACAIKQINPNVKVYGVQAENADAIVQSFNKKEKVSTDSAITIADGIAVKTPGDTTLSIINEYVDGMISVSDNDISNAILLLIERSKRVVEAAGASTLAAALSNKIDIKGKKVVCVLSGGNIDVSLIGKLIEKALIYRGRIASLFVFISDNPAELSKVVNIISDSGGLIINIEKSDIYQYEPTKKNYYVTFECSGEEKKQEIVQLLKDSGVEIVLTDELEELYIEKLKK